MTATPSDCCPEVGAIVQRTVANGEMPALVVVHDDEGDWLIGDGVNDPNVDDACGLFHLGHVIEMDPSLMQVLDLPAAHIATRESAASAWEIAALQYED
ncbi:hypothetical protein [Lentzea roselyniae]|uniref:hypothetical protein n=1 Tax=Lentzea roselyniae TaxID=531940 RepID=UPI0031F870C1